MENTDFQKKVLRELSDIKQYLELVYKEREILEDILGRLALIEEKQYLNKQHQDNIAKNMKSDMNDVQSIVEAKVDETIQVMDSKTVVVKTNNHNIFQSIKDLFKKKSSKKK